MHRAAFIPAPSNIAWKRGDGPRDFYLTVFFSLFRRERVGQKGRFIQR